MGGSGTAGGRGWARHLHGGGIMRSLLAALPAVLALTLTGCLADTSDTSEEDSTVDDAVTSCKGPFDCKLPNSGAANANRATDPQNGTDAWPIKAGTVLYNGFGET